MEKDREENYNEHAKLLADIALSILNGNKNALDINGIKEIIALYLLIPYMTKSKLQTPGENCKIPSLDGEFIEKVTYEDLRNTICHSFVTVEEDKGDNSVHGRRLIFDDRIKTNPKDHSKQGYHSKAVDQNIKEVHDRLLEAIAEILKGV